MRLHTTWPELLNIGARVSVGGVDSGRGTHLGDQVWHAHELAIGQRSWLLLSSLATFVHTASSAKSKEYEELQGQAGSTSSTNTSCLAQHSQPRTRLPPTVPHQASSGPLSVDRKKSKRCTGSQPSGRECTYQEERQGRPQGP